MTGLIFLLSQVRLFLPQAACHNASVEGFTTHSGKIAVLDQDHVDTDRIIPARFLSMVTRSGYGALLFKDVRSDDFPLDRPEAQGASILVVGTNFGCGSSREHAVWAIQQAGFKAVIGKKTPQSTAFSDIFRGNAANCGLLLIDLDSPEHEYIASLGAGARVEVDLPDQEIRAGSRAFRFEINSATKDALVRGLDLIGTTLLHEGDIDAYEHERGPLAPNRL